MVPPLSALSLALCYEALVGGGNHKNISSIRYKRYVHIYSIRSIDPCLYTNVMGKKCIANDKHRSIKGSVIFYREGGLWKFFKFCEFLVIPLLYEWNFSDPPWAIAEFKWSPQPHNKSGRISFCIRSWDWPSLGLVKSEGREFKRNFNSCSNKTTKFASYQYLLQDW